MGEEVPGRQILGERNRRREILGVNPWGEILEDNSWGEILGDNSWEGDFGRYKSWEGNLGGRFGEEKILGRWGGERERFWDRQIQGGRFWESEKSCVGDSVERGTSLEIEIMGGGQVLGLEGDLGEREIVQWEPWRSDHRYL